MLGQGIQTLEDGSVILPMFGNNLVQVDLSGRLEGVLNSRGDLTTFSYDAAGNLSQRIAADLKVTDYGYNDLNRLVAITNQGVEAATFDHDANGNLVEATSPSLSTAIFGYDEMSSRVCTLNISEGSEGAVREVMQLRREV